MVVAEVADLVDGRVVVAERAGTKQPDWTYDETYSGKYPAQRLGLQQPEPGE